MALDFWTQALSFGFIVTFGLVLLAFLPLLLSLRATWMSDDDLGDSHE